MSRTHQAKGRSMVKRCARAVKEKALELNIVLLDDQAEIFARATLESLADQIDYQLETENE